MKKLFWVALAVVVMGSAAGCTLDYTYAYCSTDDSCNDSRDSCFGVTVGPAATSGQFCSRTCVSDADCESNYGFPGACYNIESTTHLCYQTCTFDSDCYGSSVCIQLTLPSGATDYVCVPNN